MQSIEWSIGKNFKLLQRRKRKHFCLTTNECEDIAQSSWMEGLDMTTHLLQSFIWSEWNQTLWSSLSELNTNFIQYPLVLFAIDEWDDLVWCLIVQSIPKILSFVCSMIYSLFVFQTMILHWYSFSISIFNSFIKAMKPHKQHHIVFHENSCDISSMHLVDQSCLIRMEEHLHDLNNTFHFHQIE